jgi:hypothetical protein
MNEQQLAAMRAKLKQSQNQVLPTAAPTATALFDFDAPAAVPTPVYQQDTEQLLRFQYLTPLLQQTMLALKKINNVPDEMAIQAILGTVNFATQSLYNVDPVFFGGNMTPTSEYFVALAPTAGMKSTVYKMLDAGIRRWEDDEKVRYNNEVPNYRLAQAVWKKEYEKLFKSMDSADLQDPQRFDALVASLGPEPRAPRGVTYRLSTGTRNGMIDALTRVPFCGMSSSEAGEFFNGHSFRDGKNNAGGLEMITTLTNLWDGHSIEKNTGVESVRLNSRRFTMLFLLQKAMARDWLGNSVYSEQGFVHRLLITHSDYWDVPDLDIKRIPEVQRAQQQLQPFHERIYQLMSETRAVDPDWPLELVLPTITMTPEAIELLTMFANEIKRRQARDFAAYIGFCSRLYEHAVRLAATLAIFDRAQRIDSGHARSAVELAYFYLEQRMSLDLGANTRYQSQVDVAGRLAEHIEQKLREGAVIDRGWLNRRSPSYFRGLAVEERRKIVQEIESRGRLRLVETATGTRFELTPEADELATFH